MRKRVKLILIFGIFVFVLFGGIRNGLGVSISAAIAITIATGTYAMTKDDAHIRGKRLLSYGQARELLRQLCKRNNDAGFYGFGGVILPKDAKYKNFLFQGGTGTGKTLSLLLLMYEALKNGRPNTTAMIHDFKMTYPSFLAHIGIEKERIKILNPFDARCFAWDIQGDCVNDLAAWEIAESLAPGSGGKEGVFFDVSARVILASVMKFFLLEGKKHQAYRWTLRDVVEGATSLEDMREMFTRYGELRDGLTYLNKPNADVDRTIVSNIFPLRPIAALWEGKEPFSFTRWKSNPNNDILLIGYDAEYKTQSSIINGLFVRLAAKSVLARPINDELPDTWFFLDEFPTIKHVPGFADFMSTARDFKASVALVFQSIEKLRDPMLYGHEKASSIAGDCANKVFFNCTDEAAKWASDACGSREVWEESTHDGISGGRFNTGTGEAQKLKPLVLKDEIEQLKLLRHDGRIHAYFVTADLNGSPYYGKFDKNDFASIWKENGYPTDYAKVTDPDATNLKPWSDEDRIRLGLTPRENAPTEKPKKKRINIELQTGRS